MAEKRLIDANNLIERLKLKKKISEVGLHRGLQSAMSQCDKAPTVDAVEVCRCKDCDYFTEHNDVRTGRPLGYGECHRYMGLLFRDEDFCCYGERRTDG